MITPESCEGFNCLEFKYKIYKENFGVSSEGLQGNGLQSQNKFTTFSFKDSKFVSLMTRLAAACEEDVHC